MPEIPVAKDQSATLPAARWGIGQLAAAVLPGWLLALLGSALIVAIGRRWPTPLPVQPLLALALVLLPPLALLLWLLLSPRSTPATHPERSPGAFDRGESSD